LEDKGTEARLLSYSDPKVGGWLEPL
jgi:hypothetical protein